MGVDGVLAAVLDDVEGVEVILEAAANNASSVACHQMGIPSHDTVVVDRTEYVLMSVRCVVPIGST